MIYISPPAGGGLEYTDRGDVGAWDYRVGDFDVDYNWHDMDLSSIVGVGARLVLIRITLKDAPAEQQLKFRTKGYTGDFNNVWATTIYGDNEFDHNFWILTDASGVIQYSTWGVTYTKIDFVVRGWLNI